MMSGRTGFPALFRGMSATKMMRWHGDGAEGLSYEVLDILLQIEIGLRLRLQDREDHDVLSLYPVRLADNGCRGDGGMLLRGCFNLRIGDSVACHLQDVVSASRCPENSSRDQERCQPIFLSMNNIQAGAEKKDPHNKTAEKNVQNSFKLLARQKKGG